MANVTTRLRKHTCFLFAFVLCVLIVSRASAQSQFFCWVAETPQSNPYAEEGHPAYFTALITARDKDSLASGLFAQYVVKKYAVRFHGPPYCTQLANNNLQERIGWVKQHGGTAVMTEWTPDKHEALMAELAKNPPAPPPAAPADKKTPPPSAAQTAYEKAMAEQRPQSVGQAQLAAAAKANPAYPNRAATSTAATTAPAGATLEKYSFCYTMGSPYRGPGQMHYYVTQVFAVAGPDPRRATAFQAYLHGQHPQESIGGSSCSTPGPMSAEESTRQGYIENQRKMPNRAIVELSWKPGS